MKLLTRITKLELNNLFYSPLAWLAMVVFAIFCGSNVVSVLDNYAFRQSLYDVTLDYSITEMVFTFAPNISLYHVVVPVIIILIPLMVMGVISRENQSGTIKMLFSSPIKLKDIVLGKFLAVMVFVTLFMLILLSAVVTGVSTIESADLSSLLPGFIGLYLLAALVAAVTVYLSTFSSYPVIDVLGTITIVYGIDLLYGQVKEIPVVSEIVFWLAPTQQLGFALKGLLLSRTVLYFITLITLFLVWAYFNMRLKRETIKGKRAVRIKMFSAFLVAMVVVYFAIQPKNQLYKDFTKSQGNVLSSLSKNELNGLKNEPMTITTYIDMMGNGMGIIRPAYQMFDQDIFFKYRLEFPQIAFRYIYFYDEKDVGEYEKTTGLKVKTSEEIVKNNCENYFVDRADVVHISELPESVKKLRQNRLNQPRDVRLNKSFRVLEAKGKQSLLELSFDDTRLGGRPDEGNITTAFKVLVEPAINLGFVVGHGELDVYNRAQNGLARVFSAHEQRRAFVNEGFKVDKVLLQNPVSNLVDVLVVASPKTAYSKNELENLSAYITSGRDLLVLSDAGLADVVNPILHSLGITQRPGMLVNDDERFPADYNIVQIPEKLKLGPLPSLVQMPTAAALKVQDSIGDFESAILLSSNENTSWVDTGAPDEYGAFFFEPIKDEVKASYPLLIKLNRKINIGTQTIIVAGDSDFLTNDRMVNAPQGVGFVGVNAMITWLKKWFSAQEYPLQIDAPKVKDGRMKIPHEHIKYLKALWYAVLPGIFMVFGLRMLRKRMKK